MRTATVFPIEVDLSEKTFNYNPSGQINDGISDDEENPSGAAAAAPSAGRRTASPAVSQGAGKSTDDDINLLDLS
jgi:hypothetical protein